MKVTPSPELRYYRPDVPRRRPRTALDLDPVLIRNQPGAPRSGRFEDVYFSDRDGLAEARHVFLDGTGLPEAWRGRALFVIAETGFGTGLNFLATWDLWRRTAGPGTRLHYLSVERYPLCAGEISACLAPWSELAPLAAALRAVYPPPHAGFHRVWLDRGRVALTLMVGPVAEMLTEAEAQVDAWYLDGFAPSRNPDMWSPQVFAQIARLSAPGARLATFTAASAVRRGLAESGFAVEKRPGFGAKREMITARYTGPGVQPSSPPWYRTPEPCARNSSIAVIGGGIAGCAVAGALVRRGQPVTLIDRWSQLAGEASGNPAAMIAPQLGLTDSAANGFHDRAYRMALASIRAAAAPWDGLGVLQAFAGEEAARRVQSVTARAALWRGAATALEPSSASDRAGVDFPSAAAWCPEAGLVDPAEYARRLARGAERITEQVRGLRLTGDGGWTVAGAAETAIAEADAVVIAAAQGSLRFHPAGCIPLNAVLGQISRVPVTDRSAGLRTVVQWGGYLTPARDGGHVLGATYARDGFDPDAWPQPVTDAAHWRNTSRLPPALRMLLADPGREGWSGRAAVRCATPDRLPVVGPVVEEDRFLKEFSALQHGPRGMFPPHAVHHPGLFLLAGLGSRGIMTAALSAEILACLMLGEPWPVERRIVQALSPTRFLVRRLVRPGR